MPNRMHNSSSAWPSINVTAAFFVPALGVLALIVIAANFSNRPPGDFTRDPLVLSQSPFYVGALSNAGVIVWCAASVVCLFSALLLHMQKRDRHKTLFFARMGAFTALLALDDLYMLHDQVFPEYIGIPEPVVLTAYALGAGVLAVKYWRVIVRSTPWGLFVLALIFFGGSLIYDFTYGDWWWHPVIEDALKFLGITAWLAYFTTTGAMWITAQDDDSEAEAEAIVQQRMTVTPAAYNGHGAHSTTAPASAFSQAKQAQQQGK